jgi:hypothetical protein
LPVCSGTSLWGSSRLKPAVKTLVRYLGSKRKVIFVNEFLTSKKCPRCQIVGDAKCDYVCELPGRMVKCSRCTRQWDRDQMAAMNIREVFEEWLRTGTRPPYLSARWMWKYDPALGDNGLWF